jgi:hypothetical protein
MVEVERQEERGSGLGQRTVRALTLFGRLPGACATTAAASSSSSSEEDEDCRLAGAETVGDGGAKPAA